MHGQGKKRRRSEAKKGLVRIGSNYIRLIITVLLGLWLIRLLWNGLGPEGYGLVGLVGSTIGIAAMVQQIIRSCLIRELAEAYHSADPEEFPKTYNAALLLAVWAALFSLALFTALYLAIPYLHIPDKLLYAAKFQTVCKAAESLLVVVVTPIRNMEVVAERMVGFNIWKTLDRAAYTIAAILIFPILGITDVSLAVIYYSLAGSILFATTEVVRALIIIRASERLIPRPWLASASRALSLLKTSTYNVMVLLAHNLHHRADALVINIFLGTTGLVYNGGWSLAISVSEKMRLLSRGMTDGVDAVAARMSLRGGEGEVRDLMRHSTRLQTFVTLPLAVACLLAAEPIIRAVVGSAARNPAAIDIGVVFLQITALGSAARAVGENWSRVLYGAGHIRGYAWLLVSGGLANPLLAVALIYGLPALNPAWPAWWGPAIAFTASLVVVQYILMPILAAKLLATTWWRLVSPTLPCMACSAAAAPVLVLAQRVLPGPWTWYELLAVLGAYGAVYSVLCLAFAMTGAERRRALDGALAMARGRSGRSQKPGAGRMESSPDPRANGAAPHAEPAATPGRAAAGPDDDDDPM